MTDLLNDTANPVGNLISYTFARAQKDEDLAWDTRHSADGLLISRSFRGVMATGRDGGLDTFMLQNANE